MKDCVVQRDSLSCLHTVNVNWISVTRPLPSCISFVKARRTTAVSHTDFLMSRTAWESADVYWCHVWHEQSWCGYVKLAMMPAWKQLCMTHMPSIGPLAPHVLASQSISILSNSDNGRHSFSFERCDASRKEQQAGALCFIKPEVSSSWGMVTLWAP